MAALFIILNVVKKMLITAIKNRLWAAKVYGDGYLPILDFM